MIIRILLFVLIPILSYSQWTQTNGPYGGWVESLAIKGNNMFAGTRTDLFRSSDNGSTWTQVNIGTQNPDVFSLVVSENNILAGTDNGVFVSTNNSVFWSKVLTDNFIYSFVINKSNVYAGSLDRGIYFSSNNGLNWVQINNNIPDSNITSLAISGDKLIAGTWGGGVCLSSDNGTTWVQINNGLLNPYLFAVAIQGNTIFAGCTTSPWGIYSSTDFGANWTQVFTDYPVVSFAVNGINIYAGSVLGVYLSTDSGISWNPLNNYGVKNVIWSFAISCDNIFIWYLWRWG